MTLVIFRIIYIGVYGALVILIWDNRERLGRFLFFILAAVLLSSNFYIIYYKAVDIEKFFLSRQSVAIKEVISGNEFKISGFIKNKRSLILDGTGLPADGPGQENARLELEKLLDKQKVTIEFLPGVDYATEPWPILAYIDGEEINQRMVQRGFLLADETSAAPAEIIESPIIREEKDILEKVFRIWVILPLWSRYLIWAWWGFLGSNALARYLIFKRISGNPEKIAEAQVNLIMFMVIFLSAAYSTANSYFNKISIFPPIVCLGLTILMVGFFMKQTREKYGAQ